MMFPVRLVAPVAIGVMFLGMAVAAEAQTRGKFKRLDAPFVGTPHEAVAEMLKLAKVGPNDVVYDLGSGDGRIVITAAQKYGARGVGIELDRDLVNQANRNARAAGVQDRVRFRQGDLFRQDLSAATVVTLFLSPSVNLRLQSKLLRELKPGTRVVSHQFPIGDWTPQSEQDVAGRTVYFWVVPDR
jgi:protein-L-isoaspartate O-methyltransferase